MMQYHLVLYDQYYMIIVGVPPRFALGERVLYGCTAVLVLYAECSMIIRPTNCKLLTYILPAMNSAAVNEK